MISKLDNGREFNVQADQAQFDKLKEGDRVKVAYRVGKYAGTVWSSEIK
jgi:Cu/Ag efflux protein CusF